VKRFLIGLALAAMCAIPAVLSSTAAATRAGGIDDAVASLNAAMAEVSSGSLQRADDRSEDDGKKKPKPPKPPKPAKFKDTEKDAGCCSADITDVQVALKNGVLSFTVVTKNAKGILPADIFDALYDTDRNASTGNSGFEYGVVIDGDCGGTPCAAVWHWNGASWDMVDATGTWRWKSGPQFNFLVSDIGSPAAFDLAMWTQWGATTVDYAPDSGVWTFSLV
jgi:hypothetical protein